MQTPDPSALSALVSPAQEIHVAGKAIRIRPLTVGQLPGFLRAAQPIIAELSSGDIAQALLREPAAVIEAITIACAQDRVWIDSLYSDDLIKLGTKCIEINLDFFIRRLLPEITAAAETIETATAGLNLPSSLSATATAIAKS